MPAPRRNPGALVATIAAGLLTTVLLALGGALLLADGEKDSRGYLSTSSHAFAAPGRAIAIDDLDVDLGGADAVVRRASGKVRIAATGTPRKRVFIGIARSADVSGYLHGAAYSSVRDIESSPFRAVYGAHRGNRRPGAPAAQHFWVASAHGAGDQSLTWKLADGAWSVVVMNDDASPGVAARLSAGASFPWLRTLAFGLLIVALIPLAGVLLRLSRDRRATRVCP